METFNSILSISLSLFLLMDPIGNVPVYVSLLKELPEERQRKIIIRELFIALGVIILFSFVGNYLLEILKITQDTVYIAGGTILFLIALKMIFSMKQPQKELPVEGEPFIVPLAIPLVAGPSVLAAVMIYSHQIINPWITVIAICIAWVFSTIILVSSPFLKKILGKRGIVALERLMGLILTLISIQMFLEGIKTFLLTR